MGGDGPAYPTCFQSFTPCCITAAVPDDDDDDDDPDPDGFFCCTAADPFGQLASRGRDIVHDPMHPRIHFGRLRIGRIGIVDKMSTRLCVPLGMFVHVNGGETSRLLPSLLFFRRAYWDGMACPGANAGDDRVNNNNVVVVVVVMFVRSLLAAEAGAAIEDDDDDDDGDDTGTNGKSLDLSPCRWIGKKVKNKKDARMNAPRTFNDTGLNRLLIR
jgi:hypothetical protein